MPGYVIGNFFVYSVINAFTPGLGNILALNTVTNYGWKKGTPLFFGIFSGYYVVQMICAVFVYGVSTLLPEVLGGGNEVCGSCLYPLAGSPYSCQPAGWRWRREIGLFFKRVYAAVCECEDLSFWDHGIDRICDKLQYGSAGIGFL